MGKCNQTEKIHQQKLLKEDKKIDVLSESAETYLTCANNNTIDKNFNELPKTKHVFIPKLKRKELHLDKELKLRTSSVETRINRKVPEQCTVILKDETLNENISTKKFRFLWTKTNLLIILRYILMTL